ncbi:MAG: AAA family ATPase [Chitinophagaceae bacterium]|nr:AAA family ATPase [Chitinophagaceae bacterium]
MEILLEQTQHLLAYTDLSFKRFLFDKINWNDRLIGIKGARGTGKTTLLLQWLSMQKLPAEKAAYFSLDDLYFTKNTLKETVALFYKQGGTILVLDEVHKYKNWALEIKNCHDFYPNLQIIFTGSSIIDISKQQGDLSRRSIMYDLPGLSFREYLIIKKIYTGNSIQLHALLKNPELFKKLFPAAFRPLAFFKDYLMFGYYPFAIENPNSLHQRINQLIRTIVEMDMATLKDFDIRNAQKILQLIYVIAQQVPFKPNLSSLAEKTGIHRNSLNSYLYYLEQAKIISLLYPAGKSTAVLQKPEKIYLQNTNLLFALGEKQTEIGNVRETFFHSQLSVLNNIHIPKQGDFLIDQHYHFEVGGKNKSLKQIESMDNAWVVKDDIEYPTHHTIPLWMFGFLY